jgi:hypothetical protein
MPTVRTWSINQLSNTLTSSEKAELGKKYGVASWVQAGYIALVGQDEPIEEGDWSRLGVATIVRLAEARESQYQSSFANYRSANPDPTLKAFPRDIETPLPKLPSPDIASAPSDLVARIKVATELNMPDVLRQAYISLVERSSSLTADEAERLGNTEATQIMQARMLLRKRHQSDSYRSYGYSYSYRQQETPSGVVERLFASELQRAQTLETEYLNPPEVPSASRESSGICPKCSKKVYRPKGNIRKGYYCTCTL